MRWYHWSALSLVISIGAAYLYIQNQLSAPLISHEQLVEMRRDYKHENESAFVVPAPKVAKTTAFNPLGNVYFGDLHVHSSLSFDSYIFGNRLDMEDAYRFAKGQRVYSPLGEPMQLTVPLDFAALTDHAEGFGIFRRCAGGNDTLAIQELCEQFENPNAGLFLHLRSAGEKRPPSPIIIDNTDQEIAKTALFAQDTWADIVNSAEAHNEPGKFTTFAAYEYSPPLPDRGKIHRNVIFRNNHVPKHAISAFDALTELDLWRKLDENCLTPCEYMTIPHNPNKSWGLAFASNTIDGDVYSESDWRTRKRVEPLVEMYQIKGNSECSIGAGTTDEECSFEQYLPRCDEGQVTNCISSTSMARDGLKIGLKLDEKIGINPLKFGMIGSTDNHNSTPGDTEEWDYRGAAGLMSASAMKRLSPGPEGNYRNLFTNPGGLAAIWAPENTRDALYDAMQRKEVYATSGTRIGLRFFASFGFEPEIVDDRDMLSLAYQQGVPMGSTLVSSVASKSKQPSFLIWATQDPLNAPLDRIQLVKGWTEDGNTYETVEDVICSEGRSINSLTKRCPETRAKVNINNCEYDTSAGGSELIVHWTDQDYKANQNAFYYVRVIQNPSCRWSSYDSLRLGKNPPNHVPNIITEMAWSSPIWVSN